LSAKQTQQQHSSAAHNTGLGGVARAGAAAVAQRRMEDPRNAANTANTRAERCIIAKQNSLTLQVSGKALMHATGAALGYLAGAGCSPFTQFGVV
jgi:hypothetical protein